MDSDSGITSSPGSDTHEHRYPEDSQDHLRRLEMSLMEKGMYSIDENSSKSDESDEANAGAAAPKGAKGAGQSGTGSKVKMHKCKQCDFVASSKVEFWAHSKVHIKAEKQLGCTKCPFVTEYKHHMEYHLRNHSGSKPYKCDKCEYQCVNKSMLNSHMKSHSNLYRYNCKDCSYATKYCHSLKIHLKKYKHQPDVVLDELGNPCPDIIIDVYGTRRGPKLKAPPQLAPHEPAAAQQLPPPVQDVLPFGLNLMAAAAQFPCYPFFASQQLMHNFQQLVMEQQQQQQQQPQPEDPSSALDLSKPAQPKSHRRKGPAFKLDRLENESEEEAEEITADVEPVLLDDGVEEAKEPEAKEPKAEADNTTCQYCSISFGGDPVLYMMHMGYHGFNSPFTCNMCGVECGDKVNFFLHIARTPHL